MRFTKWLAQYYPFLRQTLQQAGLSETPEHFLKKVLTLSFMASFSLAFFVLGPLIKFFQKPFSIVFFVFFLLFFFFYRYFLKIPEFYIIKEKKRIMKELLFALRFFIISLESGLTLDKAFQHIREHYPTVGKYFGYALDQITYGTNINEALQKAALRCPSEHLQKVFLQIQNSLRTGVDMSKSLTSLVDQISREQKIMLMAYAKKLNPFAMFYMILAVIFPSLGFIMIIILGSFIGFQITSGFLWVLVFILTFLQFLFYSTLKTLRPPVDLS